VIAIFGILPTWRILLLPAFVVLALLIALGAGLWITALTVKYRDFRFITPFILQIGVFVTPVGFRTDLLPNWRDLIALNPVSGVIEGVRWSLLGGQMDLYWPGLGISVAVATLLLGTGVWFFRKTERQFADVI
jgi:lipopolysaccharide transport system permease protein